MSTYKDFDWSQVILNVFVTVCVALVGMVFMNLGRELERAAIRKQAFEAGVGQWVCNPETGKSMFVFKASSKP